MLGAMTQQETQYVAALKKQAEQQIAQLVRERQSLANENAILKAQGRAIPVKTATTTKVIAAAKTSTPVILGVIGIIIWYMLKKGK